jgi:NAD(P)-dependent dehydrogenase (short-subunit alcohol dehydrogenase family)
MTLYGKKVLITGASGGLGTYVTRAFLHAGASVVGVARSIRKEEFPHAAFKPLQASVSSPENARMIIEQAGDVDVLVHLMGGFAGGMTVDATDLATVDKMFDMNFKSAYLMLAAALPGMRARKSGIVLAIGTGAAVNPVPTLGVYAASKAALVSLIRTVALETAADGICANTILPGTMDTPANRVAMPDADFSKWVPPSDVADLLVHLAMNPSVTGAVIPITGKG